MKQRIAYEGLEFTIEWYFKEQALKAYRSYEKRVEEGTYYEEKE